MNEQSPERYIVTSIDCSRCRKNCEKTPEQTHDRLQDAIDQAVDRSKYMKGTQWAIYRHSNGEHVGIAWYGDLYMKGAIECGSMTSSKQVTTQAPTW
jgi:hypothetical protein